MEDPLGIMGAETIFVMAYYKANVLAEFEDMDMFKAGIPRKKCKLPYRWDGLNRWSCSWTKPLLQQVTMYSSNCLYSFNQILSRSKFEVNTGLAEDLEVSYLYYYCFNRNQL